MRTERSNEFEKVPIEPGIDVICGPMFSGKSDELIRRMRVAPYAGYKVQAFKPDIDDRRGRKTINTEDDVHYPATPVSQSEEILSLVDPSTDIIGIDEAQFFDNNLPDVCEELAKQGKRVIVAGLDKNFRGEPFGPMAELKLRADNVDSLHAYCVKCGQPASFTQRVKIVDGQRMPVSYRDPLILVGAESDYEARCRKHHEVPGKPSRLKRK